MSWWNVFDTVGPLWNWRGMPRERCGWWPEPGRSRFHRRGRTRTRGYTVDGFDLSASAGYTVSNATNLSQLRGKFDFATTGEQIVGGTSLTVFWNSSHTVYGVTFGIAAGGGVYGGFGTTNTGVFMFKGWSSTLAKGISNALLPPGLQAQAPIFLNFARWFIDTQLQSRQGEAEATHTTSDLSNACPLDNLF